MIKAGVVILVCVTSGVLSYAQSTGTIHGSVFDPSNAAVAGVTITIQNPVSGFSRTAQTDPKGDFTFVNVPLSSYHLTATAEEFQPHDEDVNVRSPVPIDLTLKLQLRQQSTAVTVTTEGQDLINTTPTTQTYVDRELFQKLPLDSSSSQLSSLVTLATPGVAADSNGLFHGLGDHAENSFSLDGQPITDQQSKVFSNQIPADAVQSMQVIEGAPPAEYGDKTSLIIDVTTRSGLGVTQPHGNITASYGTFGTYNAGADLAYGTGKWGNFVALSGLNTGRFLDPPEFGVMHDKGNEENFFDRIDWKPTDADSIFANVQFTRSWFQTPNSFDAQGATAWNGLVADNGGLGPNGLPVGPTDQRSKIRTYDIAPVWTRLLNPNTVFTFGGFARQDQFNYYPSDNPFSDLIPDLQDVSIGQDRRLTNLGLRSDLSYVKGIHNLKIGAVYEDTILTESDAFGIVDPLLNAPCLNANGSPYTGASITDPINCTGSLSPNSAFSPLLACYDLTRTAALPASDGCPKATSNEYLWHGHADIRQVALYVQDAINFRNWHLDIGIRGDIYNGLVKATQAEPRAGIAYNIKQTNTVLRVSYARTLETPFNENLILSSTGCSDPVVSAVQGAIQGYPCLTNPVQPGYRNEFHAGLQQAFGKYFMLDGEYIWKYTRDAYDFSVFANTPITYPIEWARSKIPGFAIRGSMPNYHGLTAFVVMSHVAARFFTPQISGIGVTPTSTDTSSVFRIDHDEAFNQTTHLQYQPWKNGPWIGFNWRYDSGLVAGPVPCAGGNCANGPLGTDSTVDLSNVTPDQQYQAGLYCGTVHATPFMPISPNGLCPASQYGSNLVQIPGAGTENDDHNPPRIAPRNLFDLAIGEDNIFHGDRYKWSARLEIINLSNEYALYNFLSTFSGTHYVTPRTFTGTIGFHF